MNLNGLKISGKDEKKVEEILTGETQDFESGVRTLAKGLAQISGEAIIYAFGEDKVYYTGLSNLFGKKEFLEPELVVNISGIFDRCEEYLDVFENLIIDDPRFLLGSEQPFGEDLSVLAARVRKDKSDMLMMVGLNRMDYKRNYALIQKISEILNSL
jgi:transcriptional regulator of heat shock response